MIRASHIKVTAARIATVLSGPGVVRRPAHARACGAACNTRLGCDTVYNYRGYYDVRMTESGAAAE